MTFQLLMQNFLLPLVQILILFIMVYAVLYYLRNTHGALVLSGFLMALLLLGLIAEKTELTALSKAFNALNSILPLLVLVIFQPELRRALATFGSLTFQENRRRREVADELLSAVQDMAHRKCGALIVIEGKMHQQTLIDDGFPLDAKVNFLLLESIFYPNSPLHDGAILIRSDRIVAARVVLPMTKQREEYIVRLGTRHRAAIGISEKCDAVAVVVSEETGTISLACNGELHRDLTVSALRKMLTKLIVEKDPSELDETVKQINEEEENTELNRGNDETETDIEKNH